MRYFRFLKPFKMMSCCHLSETRIKSFIPERRAYFVSGWHSCFRVLTLNIHLLTKPKVRIIPLLGLYTIINAY